MERHQCGRGREKTSVASFGRDATGLTPVGLSPRFEPLEPRVLLSASLPVPVGTQPVGSLTGKIVYVHGGHGWQFTGSSWVTQRPEVTGTELVEDFGNIDQMNFLVDYLWNAGATVVPLRPAGNQVNEVVLDNDDPEVSFVGSWSNSSSTIFYGDPGDVPYRFASTSATETAYARYRPDIPEAGMYPIYAWTRAGSDRVEQLYRVHHNGGVTEVTVNHRRVGNGWVYLGEYYLEAGTDAYVDISNRSTDPNGSVIIADAIRFGNGIGDSGNPREDESTLYWVQEQLGQNASGSVGGVVSASVRHAARMNRSADGGLADRVFVSFHSNAGSGSSRGVLGLYNGNNNPATATPNQLLLADTLAREVNDDLVAQAGAFEHDWQNRTVVTLDRSDIEFGEINNLYVNNEFDATIIETGFHDNLLDAQMLRDPKVRDAIARATYQGLLEYFNDVDGGATPVAPLPGPVSNLRALPTATDGTVVLAWEAPPTNGIVGGTPTGYRVYTSADGRSFDGGTFVPGAGTFALINGLDPANGPYYFKVAAVNAAGESLTPDVVAATPYEADQRVLIVNGFDRFDRFLNVRMPFQGEATDRVKPQFSNSFDYAIQHAEAIAAFSADAVSIETVQNEAVINGQVDLSGFDAVVWILGEESSADDTFNATEQALVTSYLNGGGNLFVSGAEIGWDLDNLNNGRSFYNNTLRADYVADDANTYQASGVTGGIFDGIALTWDDGDVVYDANFADVIIANAGSQLALEYSTGGGAGIVYNNQLVMLGLPFETILDEADRNAIMAASLAYFGLSASLLPGDHNNDGSVSQGDLDLVLLNWGVDTDVSGVPAGWLNTAGLDGVIDQGELDQVLINWGNTAEPNGVAEPGDALAGATAVLEEEPTPDPAQAVAAQIPAVSSPGLSVAPAAEADELFKGEAAVFRPSDTRLAEEPRTEESRPDRGSRSLREYGSRRHYTTLATADPGESVFLSQREEYLKLRSARTSG